MYCPDFAIYGFKNDEKKTEQAKAEKPAAKAAQTAQEVQS